MFLTLREGKRRLFEHKRYTFWYRLISWWNLKTLLYQWPGRTNQFSFSELFSRCLEKVNQADLATEPGNVSWRRETARRAQTRLPVPNLPLCHWSSQLFDLRAPSSIDVPVLFATKVAGKSIECWVSWVGSLTFIRCILPAFLIPLLPEHI